MSEANKAAVVAFYKQALFEGDVAGAFQRYAGPNYRQHNPLIEDGMDGVRKFVAWIVANHRDARGEITTRAARRWWISSGWRVEKSSSTGT